MNETNLDAAIPAAEDFLEPNRTVLDLLEDRELVVLHEDEPPQSKTELSGRYVSGIVRLNAPPETVAETVTDFPAHSEFIKLYRDVSVVEESDDRHRVHYDARVEMALLTLNVEFVLDYRQISDREWIWSCGGGDIETYRGRVELLPVNDGETLLCLSSWIDLSGASWLLDTVLWAQPDLTVTLPVTMTSILIHGFHNRLEKDPLGAPPADPTPDPDPPSLDELKLETADLAPLLDCGTLLLFHPRRTVSTQDGPYDLLFTTGLRTIDAPRESSRDRLSNFESYPDFIDQINNVTTTELPEGFRSEWFFKLGLGILSIPVSFTIDYSWENSHRLVFTLRDGHFDLIAGGLEWHEHPADSTLYAITSGSYIHEDAPRLIRLANAIPYREIFMGVTLSTVILQKSKQWLENP